MSTRPDQDDDETVEGEVGVGGDIGNALGSRTVPSHKVEFLKWGNRGEDQ